MTAIRKTKPKAPPSAPPGKSLTGDEAADEPATKRPPLNIGTQLRHARLVRGLTLLELSERIGCSESLLSKIENERAAPSLQMLHKIVSELDTSIAQLFAHPQDEQRIVMRKGERETIATSNPDGLGPRTGVKLEWLIPYPESRLLSGSIHIIAPGGGSDGTISHEGEEVGYVLQGSFELTVGDTLYLLGDGDSFCFRSHLPHSYSNPGKMETRVLWINTPPTF
jgi:transcriptional regulator with XRE-family HTH domain